MGGLERSGAQADPQEHERTAYLSAGAAPRRRSDAGLVLCLALVTKPQLLVAPLTSLSTWFGHKAAADIQHDLEQRGVVSPMPTTLR